MKQKQTLIDSKDLPVFHLQTFSEMEVVRFIYTIFVSAVYIYIHIFLLEMPRNNYGSNLQQYDLDDVKESVRQGVTKVAGKIGSLANGFMSSLQVMNLQNSLKNC